MTTDQHALSLTGSGSRPRILSSADPWRVQCAFGRANPLYPPVWLLVLWVAVLCIVGLPAVAAVKTPKRPVITEYHGVPVVDEYQWLEDGADPEVRRWTAAQNKEARTYLDGRVNRRWIKRRLEQLIEAPSTNYFALKARRGLVFAMKSRPPAQQPMLVTLASLTNTASERVVLDPNLLDPSGGTSIDWFVPSPDGSLVAVSLSQGGSEMGTLFFYETASGRRRDDSVPRVQGPTAGGSVAWNAEGSGVFYTRYPRPGERPEADLSFYQQIYFHRLGTPSERDVYEIGREFPRIAEIELASSPDGRRILATVSNGDGGEYAHYLREPDGRWRQVTRFEDEVTQAEFGRDPLYIEAGRDDALYLLSYAGAPRGKVLRLAFKAAHLGEATPVVPEGTNVIKSIHPTASGLGLVVLDGGPSDFEFLDFFDGRIYGQADRGISAIQEVVVIEGDEIVYRMAGFTEPGRWLRYNPSRDRATAERLPLSGDAPADFGDVEVLRTTATSRDGTRVPLSIIQKKGTRPTGDHPALLTGYGGYAISLEPRFDVSIRLWLDQGGVLAVANLRGGGEYGREWHRAGQLVRKQNVFDDFVACARLLIESNYTSPAKLAIRGGSNGGLLMGALLTQQPGLVRAVVSHVGIYDMLRVERDPNGAFNVTEFGTVRDPAQFRALYDYSPLHRVTNGVRYPAVLMLTGENDGRVNPAHSRKMTARLQSATASRRPVLLRTSGTTGHGQGTALGERIEELADVYAFLFDQLEMDYSLVDRGPLVGAVQPGAAVVKAKLAHENLTARLVWSRHPGLKARSSSPRVVSLATNYNLVEFHLEGLRPDTRYHYALEVEGRLERRHQGSFRTFPRPGPASFKFAFASCARTGSTSDVFEVIRENDPLFFLHMGDFQYLDIRTNSRTRFRAAYDSVLASPQQAALYRHVPLVYVWDDHDFGGNNANRRSTTHEAARLTYEEYVPHYPLVFDREGPISQSFAVGRVKFILTDLRSQRDSVTNKDDASKSILGEAQKAWFKKELLAANGQYPLIVWMTSVPWIGQDGTNVYRNVRTNEFGFIHHTNLVGRTNSETGRSGRRGFDRDSASRTNEVSGSRTNSGQGFRGRGGAPRSDQDHWSVFSTERREIADFIKSNHIQGVCIVHGDSHMLAADDGSHSDYATGGGAPIPVMCGGPLDQEPSLKGGPYSQGVYRVSRGEGGFGLMEVEDHGDHIHVRYSGRNNKNEEKVSLHFSVPAAGSPKKRR